MSIQSFNNTVQTWLDELQNYSFGELIAKPSPSDWSVGQLYKHLISETGYYVGRIYACTKSNRNSNKEMTSEGKEMFKNNSFPDQRLEGGPANSRITQPESKASLIGEFNELRSSINDVAIIVQSARFYGKSKHPGLGYFSAVEWIQFADMHMRHHLRQKKRIDDFLKVCIK